MTGSEDPNVPAQDEPEPERDIYVQAQQALERGDFNRLGRLLGQGEIDLATLTEELRVYQAELEVQNAELREAQVVSERMALRYNTLFSAMPLAQLVVDRNGLVLDANAFAEQLFSLEHRYLRHHFLQRLVIPLDRERLAEALNRARETGSQVVEGIHFQTDSGEVFGGELHMARLVGDDDTQVQFVCAVVDLSKLLRQQEALRRSEEKLEFLAHHDTLTHLPNRTLLNDRLAQGVSRAHRHHGVMAVLFVDLDRFKIINDRFGHGAGDELLREVAERMQGQLRDSDTLARVGGDEFVVLLEDADCARRAGRVANRLLQVFGPPFQIGKERLQVSASIGISLYPADGTEPDTLLRHADIAMYEAKSRGRNDFQFFHAEMASGVVEQLELVHALRGALRRHEFLLYFQPQIDLGNGRLLGVEALLRWHHPRQGLLAPARFITLAEEVGVLGEVGSWVLETACAQLAAWRNNGLEVPRVAVNLVLQQLEQAHFVDYIEGLLQRYQLAPAALLLEVTEAMLMRQPERALAHLHGLHRLGVGVSVDDFGTGYSSLGRIARLPIDQLKIDRSFVDDIGRDSGDETTVRTIIGLGRSLGLEVIAEGVECSDQVEFLTREGCRAGQGFLYGRPVSAREILDTYHP
ncbi:putative bifunctional diguanylate cyclase/phosphodiesterase [Marichromatium bheemlicum]|uniref:EAL domain-containing protein n=1 Tax=Marichromatium bheemlicum TaxID=365339 RepID=A0ABX1I815_9GAMM|nr:EAL domain-containing protein [Marichromatium bheemlicum]NKN33699.1 EAL domain-containing protein [Marichromatium bheemlicum]